MRVTKSQTKHLASIIHDAYEFSRRTKHSPQVFFVEGLENGKPVVHLTKSNIHVMISYVKENPVIAVVGSDDIKDWALNIQVARVKIPGLQGKYHRGWAKQSTEIAPFLEKALEWFDFSKGVSFCGHSAGGAIAAILGAIFAEKGVKVNSILLFGTPRFCNGVAASYISREIPVGLSLVKSVDLVPHLIPAMLSMGVYRRVYPIVLISFSGKEIWQPKLIDWLRDFIHAVFSRGIQTISSHSIKEYIKWS